MSTANSEGESIPRQTTIHERRGNPRQSSLAVFSMRYEDEAILGAGRDVSSSGAYFVTGDPVRVHISFEVNGKTTQVPARIVRMDPISSGTVGVAVEFERPLEHGVFDE